MRNSSMQRKKTMKDKLHVCWEEMMDEDIVYCQVQVIGIGPSDSSASASNAEVEKSRFVWQLAQLSVIWTVTLLPASRIEVLDDINERWGRHLTLGNDEFSAYWVAARVDAIIATVFGI